MNKQILTELITTAITTVLVFALFNPFNFWMPMATHLLMVATLLVSFLGLSFMLLTQLHEDEREKKLRLFSYQTGYIAGMAILVMGIIYQSFSHQVDGWMVFSLVVMIATKLFALGIHHKLH